MSEQETESPTLAQRIVAAIELDLTDRRGLRQEWEGCDESILDEIRATWVAIVECETAAGKD